MNSHFPHRRIRMGFTLAELLVAATLLVAGLAFVTQGTIQTKRLMQDVRHYNLACDELSNQLERLTSLPSDERKKAISDLQPSGAVGAILVNVALKAEEILDEDGERIAISIQWDRGGPAAPMTLVGWISP